MKKFKNACKILVSFKRRGHMEDSSRVVKMDHGNIGWKCGLYSFCCTDQLQDLVWIWCASYFIYQMVNFLTSWSPIIFWIDVCISYLKSTTGDKQWSTMNLKFQIFINDFSTVRLESAFDNYTNGFPKCDLIYWSISLWKCVE